MSRLVRGLEDDRLVSRAPHPEDRRAAVIEATARGRRVLDRGRERRIAELVALPELVDPDELGVLRAASEIMERVSMLPPSARSAYAAATAERRWSGLSDDSTGSGGTGG